jgi:membrane-bound acyltransferase YfiQ involved in biofilm formation
MGSTSASEVNPLQVPYCLAIDLNFCISPPRPLNFRLGENMSFGIYAIGYLILIAGVAYLAHLMHIPSHYIVAISLIMLGIGVVTGVQTTRHKDPS